MASYSITSSARASNVADEAGYQAQFDWIAATTEDDWNGSSGCLGRERRRRAARRRDHHHVAINKISHQCGQSVVLILCPAIFDQHIMAFYVAGFAQRLAERGD